ncbi:MAG: DUF2184 domain-containing protein [Deltaproteobacteria bacterium]|nr:DUF2184 domain-containing protein [Deltaproteobacteria bacterium]
MDLRKDYAQIFLDARLDASEQIYFARELEYVKARTYDILYPQFKQRRLFPVSFEAGPWAETIKYDQFDSVGIAKIISNYATDFPRADIKGKEFRSTVKSVGAAYGYNIQEIRASQATGKRLEMRRADAAKRAHLQLERDIAFFGDAEHDIKGFLDNPNVLTGTVPVGASTNTEWSTKTPDEIIEDMNLVANAPFNATNEVENANTLLIPLAQWSYIASTPRSSTSDTSILSYFLNVRREMGVPFEVIPVPQMKSGNYPASLPYSGDLIIAYDRDPMKIQLEIPQDFEQTPPDRQAWDWVVSTHQRIGGVIIYYPLSVAIYDGI